MKAIGQILIEQLGEKNLMTAIRSLLEDFTHRRYAFHNQQWEYLRNHGKREEFEKYNAAECSGRAAMCLKDYRYCEQAIICAALECLLLQLENKE